MERNHGRGSRITPQQWDKFDALLAEGWAIKHAAQKVGISENSGRNRVYRMREAGQLVTIGKPIKPLPVGWNRLPDRAKKAFDNFEYFRLIYLGHPSMPWHVEMAETVITALESPHKEYIVTNVAPGTGKTTELHDIAAWATVRNRAIRGVIGSKNAVNAERMMMRLRRTLERTSPPKARDEDIKHGLAANAEACLAADYGLFKPATNADVWRRDQFIVVQADDTPIEEKEPTWSAYGMNSDVLSNRYDLMLWDDTEDNSTIRTMEAVQKQRDKWDGEVENRLDPRGVLLHVGQRFGSSDLYGYNLSKRMPIDPDAYDEMTEEEQEQAAIEQPRQYTHIVYKAHDDDKCKGRETHRYDAPAWPDGCLLDPKRLPWRELGRIRIAKPRHYTIQYQQEDADPDSVLIPKAWVYGGTHIDEATGEKFHAPGCVDDKDHGNRGLCELPEGLAGPLYSIATVDPSPTKMWAIQWWVYAPNAFNQVFLMDTVRRSMPGNQLLDYNLNAQEHYGVMEEWQQRSVKLGLPITHWIVETNAAQRFMLQYDHVSKWQAKWKVQLVPHQTTVRKLDENLGIDMVRDWWRYGRIRLPYKSGEAALASLKLIEEVTRYPNAGTDDQVMAHWFLFVHLPNIARAPVGVIRQNRPAYLQSLPNARGLIAL